MKSTVLIIGFVFPEPNSSAAGTRMLQLINFFISQNYTIVFATSCKKSDNAFDLESLQIEVVEILLNDSSFDSFVKELNPNIVLFDRFMTEEQFGWRVAESCPNALRILDTEDLHFLRKARQKAFTTNQPLEDLLFTTDTAKRELASIYRSDVSLVISEIELEILTQTFKIDPAILCYLPFMIASKNCQLRSDCKPFAERRDFVSIGNFLHPPNLDVVRYLKKDIWPKIKKELPEAKLHSYGAYDTPNIKEMHNQSEGFLVHGYVKDAFDVVASAKVLLAPLRFGAGLKGKLIQAMQCGTPCAMSTVAAEGMFGSEDPNGVIENEITLFVQKCIKLYSHESLWSDSQRKGFAVLENRFNKEEHHMKLKDKISLLSSTIQSHRSNNFIGQLLAHHQFQSTKYMSRWIEAKNANLK
jgi:glycosyltransferase involved in cell wall biosynthesis